MKAKLESEEFYNLMLSYRNAPINNQFNVIEKYNNLKNYILQLSYTKVDALIEKYEKKKEELIDKIKGGASKKERVSIDTEVVDYMRFIAELKNIKL